MTALYLVGIGTGDPGHLTLGAVAALNGADLILLPVKAGERGELAALRRALCATHLRDPAPPVTAFEMPERDPAIADYDARVRAWHDGIAARWAAAMSASGTAPASVALLVWGDPSLYDSTLRIAERLQANGAISAVHVVPGITAIQALCAAHRIPLNGIGQPVLVTTGRRLRADGWPADIPTVVVMLDGQCAFTTLLDRNLHIWWGAYLGMDREMLVAGPLADVSDRILAERQAARDRHGWIMDTYLLSAPADE
ncbi:precorrin-6A synthase (deacetylating) [Marinibaculum pumilum]|uniref:Precorrin-6A synthase [deacetylating] n=1 Tax=Marinibaculum pumilum TaxID=1766165 RepID=A0ABV7KXL2_9PROT